jgi:hypothetical protein
VPYSWTTSNLMYCFSALRIPKKEELPHISIRLPGQTLQTKLLSEIMAAGKVSSRGPVQITIIEEKPGALLLYWEEVPN